MSIQVIGAGQHRTGTVSLRTALEILGFRTHHSADFAVPPADIPGMGKTGQRYPEGLELFEKTLNKQPVDFEKYFRGDYDAIVDCIYAFDAIWAAYPNAKVILTLHDMDAWYKSYAEVLFGYDCVALSRDAYAFQPDRPYTLTDHAALLHKVLYPPNGEFNKDIAVAQHQAHIAKVKATVPPDQLLVFSVTKGWEPLCKFLGKPVPDVPFPRMNDSLVMGPLATSMLLDIMRPFFPEEEQAGLAEKYKHKDVPSR